VSQGISRPADFENLVSHARGWVYAAIRAIAQGCAGQALEGWKKGGRNRRDWKPLKEDDPLAQLLARPNPLYTMSQLVEDTTFFLETTGNAYWYLVFGKRLKDRPREIWPLPAQHVKVMPDTKEMVRGYVFQPGSKKTAVSFEPHEIVHFRHAAVENRWYGSGPLLAAAEAVNSDEAISEAQDYMFRNAPHPSGFLMNKSGRKWTAEQRRTINALLRRFVGGKQHGRVMFLDMDVAWQAADRAPREMGYRESGVYVREKILSIFGVPSAIVGKVADANRSNMEAQQYGFAKWTLLPLLQMMATKINEGIIRPFFDDSGKTVVEFEDPVPQDWQRLLEEWRVGLERAAVAPNEFRSEILGLEPLTADKPVKSVMDSPIVLTPEGPKPLLPVEGQEEEEPPPPAEDEEEEPTPEEEADEFFGGDDEDDEGKTARARKRKRPLSSFTASELARLLAVESEEARRFDAVAGEAVRDEVRRGVMTEAALMGVEPDEVVMDAAPIRKALEERAEKHWRRTISRTNRRELRRLLADGISERLPVKEIAEQVERGLRGMSAARATRIARTEVVGAANAGADALHEQVGLRYKRWLATGDDRTRTTHRVAHWQLRRQGSKFRVGAAHLRYPGDPAAGHPEETVQCFISYRVPVFTDKGWRYIGKITPGDRVLTHEGRFRKVHSVLQGQTYGGQVIDVAFEELPGRHGRGRRRLTITPEHRILTAKGWTPASRVSVGDTLVFGALPCVVCGEPAALYPNNKTGTCSRHCAAVRAGRETGNRPEEKERRRAQALKQWQDPAHRANVSRKAREQMLREYAGGSRDGHEITKKARDAYFSKYGPGGYVGTHQEELRPKIAAGVVRKYGSYLEFMKQVVFVGLGKSAWKGSVLESSMRRFLSKCGRRYEEQFWVGRRRVDFYLPDEKLFVECDGTTFHQDRDAEVRRDIEILSAHPDHEIAHVRYGQGDNGVPEWEYRNLVTLNHEGQYGHAFVKVTSVEIRKLTRPKRLYNLGIEEDESYVAKGLCVHNCRCTTVPEMADEPDPDEKPPIEMNPETGKEQMPGQLRERLTAWRAVYEDGEEKVERLSRGYLDGFAERARARLLAAVRD
jgi:HK97 family phage portal protein